jgi:hypothetical protein
VGLGTGPNLALTLLDLSETGIRLILPSPLPPGKQVEISLEGVGQWQPLRVAAQVVWCLATADGKQCVGLRFHKAISYADFQALSYL